VRSRSLAPNAFDSVLRALPWEHRVRSVESVRRSQFLGNVLPGVLNHKEDRMTKERVKDPMNKPWDVVTYYSEETGEPGGPPLKKHYAVLRDFEGRLRCIETLHFGTFYDMVDWTKLALAYTVYPRGSGWSDFDEDRADQLAEALNDAITKMGCDPALTGNDLTFHVKKEWL